MNALKKFTPVSAMITENATIPMEGLNVFVTMAMKKTAMEHA